MTNWKKTAVRTSANNTNKRLIFLKFDYRKYSQILLLYKSTCHLLLKWTQGKAFYSHWHLQLHTRLATRYRWRCADLHSDVIHALINTLGTPTRLIGKILGRCKYLDVVVRDIHVDLEAKHEADICQQWLLSVICATVIVIIFFLHSRLMILITNYTKAVWG